MRMDRIVHQETLTIANTANLSGAMDFRQFTMGVVLMPATWTAASLGFKVAATEDGTYMPLYTHAAAIVEVDGPAVDIAYELPPELAAASWVKLWSQDGAAANVAQGGDRELIVMAKS